MACTQLRISSVSGVDLELSNLIRLLKVVIEDVRFLQRTGQPVEYTAYGQLYPLLYRTLFTSQFKLIDSSSRRLERLGFLIYKVEDGYQLQYEQIQIPIPKRTLSLSTLSSWQASLQDR